MTTTALLEEVAPPPAIKSPRRIAATRRKPLLLFTVPALVWFVVFLIGPLVAMFWIATLSWKGLIYEPTFVGFANFPRVFDDPVFHDAIRNTAIQLAVTLPIMIPLAFMLGYHLYTKPPGYRVLSIFFFSPGLISISVTGMIFYGMLSPNGGLNGFLSAIRLDEWTTAWLANPSTALGTLVAVDLWRGIGWTAVLFAARLSSISSEVLEAAEVDGAGSWRIMWQIAFPMVRSYVGTLTMLQFLWTLFASAGLVLLLTKGGPGTSTTTLSYLVFSKAFAQQDLGYSQVVGIVLLAVGIVGMIAINLAFRSDDEK